MDLYVKNILIEWNFQDYLNAFIEQEINQESFECLDDDTLKLIFPKAGPRLLFTKKLLALKQSTFDAASFSVSVLTNVANNNGMSFVDVDPLENNETVTVENVVLQKDVTNLFQAIDNADISIKLCNPITDMIECLRNSPMGGSILSFYRKNRMLPNTYRLMLCDVILDVELRASTELQIYPARLIELSKLIVQVFPTEQAEIYYVPYHSDNITSTVVQPKRKLYVRYCHWRGILLESNVVVSSRGVKRKIPKKSTVYLGFYDDFADQESNEEIDQEIDYLQNNIDEWPTILKYWSNTSKIRLKKLIDDKDTTSTDYINRFPILLHAQKGLLLIDVDFENQYRLKKSGKRLA